MSLSQSNESTMNHLALDNRVLDNALNREDDAVDAFMFEEMFDHEEPQTKKQRRSSYVR